jgi:predicted Zn-dependent peptidase
MDTSEVAEKLGTTPRILRQFLRSPSSTFVAVGSGSRYDFTAKDLDTLRKRFADWQGAGKPKPNTPKKDKAPKGEKVSGEPSKKDAAVWFEEGPVRIEDIRDPRVRARVKRDAQAAEMRLMLLLLAKGMHVTQLDREAS